MLQTMSTNISASEYRQNIRALAELMNKENLRLVAVTNALLHCFEMVITPVENEFLLKLGGRTYTYEEAALLSGLPEESLRHFLETQFRKGLIWAE